MFNHLKSLNSAVYFSDVFEGWCASTNKSGEWFQIQFLSPAVVTELQIYPPRNGSSFGTKFRIHIEKADDTPGKFQKNITEVQFYFENNFDKENPDCTAFNQPINSINPNQSVQSIS